MVCSCLFSLFKQSTTLIFTARLTSFLGIDHFTCTVKIGDGVPLPGSEEIEERLFCLGDDADEFINRQVFDIVGDYESFFSQFSLSSGNVRIKVPFDVVTKQDEILLNEDSFKSITVIDNGEDRRLQTIPKVGTKRVLVIRVSDDNDNQKKVRFSANELSNHIFNMDNNNLVSFICAEIDTCKYIIVLIEICFQRI